MSRFQLPPSSAAPPPARPDGLPLLDAAIDWVHAVLRSRVGRLTGDNGDLPGLTVTASRSPVNSTPGRHAPPSPPIPIWKRSKQRFPRRARRQRRRASRSPSRLERWGLSDLEFRLLALALAPEPDPRYQSCVGLLLDNLGRRIGTLGLCAELLGEPSQVRRDLALAGNLARWRGFDGFPGGSPPADEPLRLDPFLCGWLLGDWSALHHDPRVRCSLRLAAWRGAALLDRAQDRDHATELMGRLQTPGEVDWILFEGDELAAWRALLELGATAMGRSLIRAAAARLKGLDAAEIEESGIRLARTVAAHGRPVDRGCDRDGKTAAPTTIGCAHSSQPPEAAAVRPRRSQVIRRAWSGCSGLHPI